MIATLLALALHAHAQPVAPPAPKFEAGRAWDHLRQLVAIGPRPSGSAAIEQARKYIKEQITAVGLNAVEQAWDEQTPIDRVHFVNLSVTIPGARKERIIFAGHYDTKLFREFRFVGASDGASSAAFLIELARVLKARKNPFTVELLFLDGEEARLKEWSGTDNTYGSRHYVEMAKRDGSMASLKALVLVDMIGDRDLDIRRDATSTPWLTDIIWNTASHQGLEDYFIADSTRIEDDHLPFLAAGVPSVDIIDLDYDAWHTAKDNLDAVSARSLQVVGDVVLGALPAIETHLLKQSQIALVRKTTLHRRAPRKSYTVRLTAHHPRRGRGAAFPPAAAEPSGLGH
jgi:glutaminyl-peptide cyclotransferase